MKAIVVLLLLVSASVFSQISTTEEEYNYLTRGMPEQIKKGLTVEKSGYSLVKFFEVVDPGTNDPNVADSGLFFVFSKFLDKENNIKAISITFGQKKGIPMNYWCFPINNKALKKKWHKSMNYMEGGLLAATQEAMIALLNNNK
jgi:hypothetical protein